MSQPLPKPIHGAAGEETDLGGGEHHPANDAAGDEDEQEGQQPGKQSYPAEIRYPSWQHARYYITYLIITGILDPILYWREPGAAVWGEGALQNDRQVHHPASEEQERRRGAGSLQHGKGKEEFRF